VPNFRKPLWERYSRSRRVCPFCNGDILTSELSCPRCGTQVCSFELPPVNWVEEERRKRNLRAMEEDG
jgi:predicted amidophosphoribosyltransferase